MSPANNASGHATRVQCGGTRVPLDAVSLSLFRTPRKSTAIFQGLVTCHARHGQPIGPGRFFNPRGSSRVGSGGVGRSTSLTVRIGPSRVGSGDGVRNLHLAGRIGPSRVGSGDIGILNLTRVGCGRIGSDQDLLKSHEWPTPRPKKSCPNHCLRLLRGGGF